MITLGLVVLGATLLMAIHWQNDHIGTQNARIGRLEADLAMARQGHPHPAPVIVTHPAPFGYRPLRELPRKAPARPSRPHYAGHTPTPGVITTAELRLWDDQVRHEPAVWAVNGLPTTTPAPVGTVERPVLRAVS